MSNPVPLNRAKKAKKTKRGKAITLLAYVGTYISTVGTCMLALLPPLAELLYIAHRDREDEEGFGSCQHLKWESWEFMTMIGYLRGR